MSAAKYPQATYASAPAGSREGELLHVNAQTG